MAFNISKKQQKNLLEILKLKKKQQEEIISIFENVKPILDENDLIQDIVSKMDSIPKAKAQEIVPTIISLNNTFNRSELSLEEFIEEILSSIDEFKSKKPKITEKDRKEYKKLLIQYIDFESIKIIFKSVDLLLEHENVLHGNPRIFSDIRPVFGSTTDKPPIGFLLVHKLKIQFKNNDEMKEIYIAMDTKDIELLREQLDRANSKAKSLESIINKTTISFIEVK